MSISQVVAMLAEFVGDSCSPLTEWEDQLVRDLKSMPQHAADRRLDRWESAYQTTWASGPDLELQNPSPTVQLLDEIFDFGCYNLYCQFQPLPTTIEYRRLIRSMNDKLGTSLKANHSVLSW